MNEFLALLQRLPRPLKYLGLVVLLTPMVYVVARLLGVEKYWWVFMLGLVFIAILLSLLNMVISSREKKQARAFEGELRQDAQKGGASKEEVRQALGDLAAKWSEASVQLKQAGLDIYSLPWYLLIGEPQSGKSTTLKNSGLEFPVGADALSGAGGTRNCDWWFANEAVILDTAGRFTFQEESAPDQAEWSSFLKLLRKYRRFCPINGVLVVIPCTSLLEDSPEEQERKATNIRQKLLHVQRVLEIRFPVFILITKADRILGFSEFFLKLDPIDQQQLFGWSSAEGPTKPYEPETFDPVYEQIATRLYRLRLKFLGDEENPAQADKLYVFPEEFRALKAPLANYFKTIFQRTRFDEPFAFRGFYVSSGVQQGRPIAQASRDLLDSPGGTAEGALENLESIFKKSRAFFIRHFYEKKVFPEQGLITRTAAAEAKQRRVLWIVRGLGVFVVILFLGGMYPAYHSLQNILKPIRKHVADARACYEKSSKGEKECSIADSYRIAQELWSDRDYALKHSFWFTLFLRGPRENELLTTLGAVQRRVYVGGVVQPLLIDAEGRMAALDWAKFTPEYKVFEKAFESMLDWRAAKLHAESDGVPLVKPEALRLQEIVEFARKAKGIKGGAKSQEIDAWIAGLQPSDDGPNRYLEGAVRSGGEIDIAVPDPAQPIAKFDEFWTVKNLARWDWTLIGGLKAYADLYTEMTSLPHPEPASYLGSFVGVGRRFKANFEAMSAHMATVRPGESGFPGADLESWKKNLGTAYTALLHWKPVGGGKISETRLHELQAALDGDQAQLERQRSDYAYLLDPAQAKKPAWSKQASTLGGMLVDLTGYADLDAFSASEDGKLVSNLAQNPSSEEKAKKIEEWTNRQDALAKDIYVKKATELAATTPDAHLAWAERRPVIETTARLAFLWRLLPVARQFFDETLISGCAQSTCYQPAFARSMIPAANGIVTIASTQQQVSTWEGVPAAIKGVYGTEITYLTKYIDQMAGRSGGGGGGFQYPSSAESALSWTAFQGAIRGWQPQAGGGGGVAADLAGQLSAADFQTWEARNAHLDGVLGDYKDRIERPRANAARDTVAPEVLEAANSFKGTVTALSDQPLQAWKQLSRGEGGASLKQYMVFSENPRLRLNLIAQHMKKVEDRGAHLMRESISPQFAPRAAEVYGWLNGCCLAKFPFIREVQIQAERARLVTPQGYQRGGSPNAATYRINLATIGPSDIKGPLEDFAAIAAEFAIDPILRGEANEFDFVGEQRPTLAVARSWQLFLYGVNAPPGSSPKPHAIEVRLLDKPPVAGTMFLGDRVSQITLFDRQTLLRPSTDVKSGRTPPPFTWRMATADSPLEIIGKNEDVKAPWTGTLVIDGGPLKLFEYILMSSEDRRPDADRRVWSIRVEIPDAERPTNRLQGIFELKLDDPLPGVIQN